MNMTLQHPWRELLLAPLEEERLAAALTDDQPQWEYIDSEMVKLGSLAHASLNINDVQQRALGLLVQESKDFRLVTHLLRTLQHGGQPDELLLAVVLLNDYVKHYWATAWPQNALHKRRLAQQIIKRFDAASSAFVERSHGAQREEMLGQLAHLAQQWQGSEPALAQSVDALSLSYRREPKRAQPVEQASGAADTAGHRQSAPAASVAPSSDSLQVDSSSDRSWRQTLLKVAELLCERSPDAPVGYRLRRHGIWGTISAPPQAQSDGRTPLAAVSADRIAAYLAELPSGSVQLWQQIEQSLTLAPYWLDGHHLSARLAELLGYGGVAQAIRDELNAFLTRLPALRTLSFTDKTPFISAETAAWLQQNKDNATESVAIEQDEIWQCYQEQGLEAALQAIDLRQQKQSEPRDRFYSQLLSAQLLERAGLSSLAQQHYQSLLLAGQQVTLGEWEPSLFAQLTDKLQR